MSSDLELRETGPDVRVLDARTGEIVQIDDLAEADTEELASVAVDVIDAQIAVMKGARGMIEDELVARLDRRRKWTVRFGDVADGVQWEIVASSPKAGATTYDVEDLREGLRRLVADQEIDEDAAAAALQRTVTIVVEVGISVDLAALVAKLSGIDAIASVPVRSVTVNQGEAYRIAGCNALDGGEDAAAAVIAKARRFTPVGRRTPKIKAKRKREAA